MTPLRAEPLQVSIAELSGAIDTLDNEPDALQALVLQKIRDELSATNLTFREGELLFSASATDLRASDSCNRTEVRTLDTSVTLASDTRLSLSLESINEPVRLTLELDALIAARGRAKQIFGFRLGGCREVGSDSFDFSADGSASISLELVLRLNPVLESSRRRLVLRPDINLSGNLIRHDIRADVDDSLLRNVLETVLEDEIDDALGHDEIADMVTQLQQDLREELNAELDNGLLVVDLPDPSDEQVDRLYTLLSPEGDFSLSRGYLRSNRLELLAALVLGDDARLTELFGMAVQCEAAGLLQVALAHEPLYVIDDQGCSAAQIPAGSNTDDALMVEQANATSWYADDACQLPVDFNAITTIDYCRAVLDTQRLGNAASFTDQLQQWTLSPGTRFDIGAVPLAGKLQPFTQRLNFKSVATQMGQCELEMRIHAPLPTAAGQLVPASGLRPLIAFHGGSWQRRSAGALGLESFATQLVNQGYVVFEPFYRLIGDAEGNMECNNATLEQVLDDASDALTWVLQNARDYGADGKPVLFGQSAGGHLAGVLAVERAAEVASAVLFYAPVDFADFIRQLLGGEIDTETGQGILEAVLEQTLDTVDVTSALVQRNTLPSRIVADSAADSTRSLPPFFLLHGQLDSVLPYQQSVRLCNALAAMPLDTPAVPPSAGSELRQILACGASGSELHLITQGEHALDLCIADELCLAGSPASAALTRDSVEQMLEWIDTVGQIPEIEPLPADDSPLADDDAAVEDPAAIVVSSGSGGSTSLWLLTVMMLLITARQSRAFRSVFT